jgi:hypothetical protein
MRYLTLFENYESDLWEEISFDEYEDEDPIRMSDKTKGQIKSLLGKGEIEIIYESDRQLLIRYTFPKEVYREFDYFAGTVANQLKLTIEQIDDYYFLVYVEIGFVTRTVKCDDIVGIKKMLIDTGILVNDETT